VKLLPFAIYMRELPGGRILMPSGWHIRRGRSRLVVRRVVHVSRAASSVGSASPWGLAGALDRTAPARCSRASSAGSAPSRGAMTGWPAQRSPRGAVADQERRPAPPSLVAPGGSQPDPHLVWPWRQPERVSCGSGDRGGEQVERACRRGHLRRGGRE
jgi:hypothetical protein